MDFSAIDGVISDMDGVLWRGDTALPGMIDFLHALRSRGIPFALATNNSTKSEAEYVAKLGRLGVSGVAEREIVTSRTAMIDYLAGRHPPGTAIYVIGSPGLSVAVAQAGFRVGADGASAVVVGIDVDFTYEKLKIATLLIRAGAEFLGTNGDVSLPSGEGLVPGAGSLLAAVEAATGQAPLVMGKPARPMYDTALRVLGTAPERTLMLGDRLNTDIAGAKPVGLKTVLLLTGVTTRSEVALAGVLPDAVYDNLPALMADWA